MKIILNKEIHRVMYIEYDDGVPHRVHTFDERGINHQWDFFANNGDKNDIRFYQSGSGGTTVYASRWADGYTGIYWKAKGLRLRGKVKNGKRLETPLVVKHWLGESDNPFIYGEESNSYTHCEVCGQTSTEWCREHMYEDEQDNYNLKYIKDNSLV